MKPIGMSYPMRRGNMGYFENTFDTFSNERVKLINLLKTSEGERMMSPTFGIGINNFLFEPDTDVLKIKIDKYMRNKIALWLPLIVIESLDIILQQDNSSVNIKLQYSVKNIDNMYDVIDLQFNAT